jgi:ribosome biogenesis GTPase
MDPNLKLKTALISDYHLQGKHTTTFYEIHPLSSGGFIIDTPGIKGFGLVEMAKEELSHYFPEMLRLNQECRFAPCTHTHEPGCRIKKAVEEGVISEERYISYLGMLEEEEKYR